MNESARRDALAVAIEALSWMELEGVSERQAFTRAVKQLGVLDGSALRFALLLIIETTRRLNLVDDWLTSILPESSFQKLDLGQKNFLRSFLYWVRIRGQPAEALPLLKAARQALGWQEMHRLELYAGKILTSNDMRTRELPEHFRLAFETFNPPWFVDYCIRVFGRTLALRYLRSTIEPPPTYVRINTLINSFEENRTQMENEGLVLEAIEPFENTFKVLRAKRPLVHMRSYRSGLFHVQDKSSCLSTLVAEIQHGENALDICAAPGGKTSHIAQLMANLGEIVSVDYSGRRMRTWKNMTKRLYVDCALPIIADAQRQLPFNSEFDVVLLDPPCTSTGAFARMPSAKWRLSPEAIEQAARMQSRMLENAATHVRNGGRLVYSTCSVTIEENELIIRSFLRSHPDFHLEAQIPFVGGNGLIGLELCQRLFQHRDGCNGYFIAKLRRTTDENMTHESHTTSKT
ncbi:MAG: RsmB/NOP family class I SAM-dependent RNA methyltransferase [archaeon]